jgi:tetratricopeptide (TPR) repeat protein
MAGDFEETRAFEAPPTFPGSLSPGAVLGGRYRLDAELGRGGMGVVYRATDLQLRRDVAVKVLSERTASADARDRLLREARAAAALNHPHIVAVHDVGEDQGIPFLVMELVTGQGLAHTRMDDLHGLVELAVQICHALAHAHAHGFVHRDLKPENVLVADGASRLAKLTDLGLAVPMRGSRLSEAGAIVGTIAYMAPEQAMGQPVDGRADLYALGAMLYELATGQPPFAGDHPLGIVSQHVNAPVVPPRVLRADLPRGLDATIVRLLAKHPDQRFATAEETAAALARSLSAEAPVDEAPAATVAILDALSRGRLVGRSEELAEAIALWRRAREGAGHALLLSGEPGVGKTRLARELMTQAGLDDAVVLAGACYEFEATTPYLPFAEAFRRWVRTQPDAPLGEALTGLAVHIAKLAPDVEARFGPFDARPEGLAHEERLLFFDAIVTVFQRLARRRGFLFYVDDLHWADASTLGLLGHVLRNLGELRILVVASYRETELDRAHPLAKALVEWNRERLITRLVLRRLGLAGTKAQLAALLGETVSDAFAAAVHGETDGNPFFAEEVLKALIEQGSVRRERGRWTHCEVGDLEVPQSLKAAIGRRLDRVSAQTNDVLRAAAILGKTFDFGELVAAAGDHGENQLLDALDESVAAQLLAPGAGDTYVFTHDKIREVLYEELNPIRRRRLHLRTAQGLERRRGESGMAVEKLAHHFIAAGDHEQGLNYAKEAASEARRVFAYDEALAAYARALECAEALHRKGEQAAIEEAMGEACLLHGNQIAALGHFERALALTTDPHGRARLQCEAASSLVVLGDERGLEYLREARAVLDPRTYPIEAAKALTIEARFHHLAGRHCRAIALLDEAVALAAPVAAAAAGGPADATIMLAYAYLAGANQHLGLFGDGDRWAHQLVEFGTAHGLPAAQALGYEFLAENAASAGNWQDGLAHVAREREIADRISSRERRAWTHLPAGVCLLGLGEPEQADAELGGGIALAGAIGEPRLLPLLVSTRAVVVAELGRFDEALEIALDALARADELGLLYMRTEARRCLAHVRYRRRELDEALRLCDEVLELTAGLEPKVTRLLMGPLHVEALLAAGQGDRARRELASYERLAAGCQSPQARREAARLRPFVDWSAEPGVSGIQ